MFPGDHSGPRFTPAGASPASPECSAPEVDRQGPARIARSRFPGSVAKTPPATGAGPFDHGREAGSIAWTTACWQWTAVPPRRATGRRGCFLAFDGVHASRELLQSIADSIEPHHRVP
jgi:hypothetical protein